MCKEKSNTQEISFDKLPKAVAQILEEISEIRQFIKSERTEVPVKRVPIELEEACLLIKKAKSTVYALVRKGLIPCYKNGKKLYFFEDELMEWITKGRKELQTETKESILEEMNRGIRHRPAARRY